MSYASSNPFLLNIVPLFNVASNPTGTIDTITTSAELSNITNILNTNTNTLTIDKINPSINGFITLNGDVRIEGNLTVNDYPFGPNNDGSNSVTGTCVNTYAGTNSLTLFNTAQFPKKNPLECSILGSKVITIDSNRYITVSGTNSNPISFFTKSCIFRPESVAVGSDSNYSPSTIFDVVNGDAFFSQNIYVQSNITCQNVYQLSDIRFKDNINMVKNALSTIQELQGITYSWKNTSSLQYGFSAQDVQTILPSIVHTFIHDKYTIDYLQLIPLLVESIKELQTRVKILELKVQEHM